MDNDVMAAAVGLNEAIKASDAYRRYCEKKKALVAEPEAYAAFSDFNKSHIDFQSRKLRGEQPAFDEEKYIAGLYAGVCLIKPVKEYIAARNSLMDLVRTVQESVFEGIDISILH